MAESIEYVVLLLGDVDRWWNEMSDEEREAGMAAHGRFTEALIERGHEITGGAELHGSARARRVLPDLSVTDGPFTEVSEQVGGYYVVRSGDLDDLTEICKILAATGDLVDIRPLVTDEERAG